MRDQWRLPPCMSPKPFKAPKKGFIHKVMGSLPGTAADPRWYQGFQKYPHLWDDMCSSPAGQLMRRCQKGTYRQFNASVTEDGAFKLWQAKRILARPRMANTPKDLKDEYQCRFLESVEMVSFISQIYNFNKFEFFKQKECYFKVMLKKEKVPESGNTKRSITISIKDGNSSAVSISFTVIPLLVSLFI